MRYLCKLTKTPTGGVVLDPFMGSGTTGIACILEHRDFIGIEIDEKYTEIARKRISDMEGPLFAVTPEVKHGEPYLYN
jgi:site-specific DNA-methyltransferase (adenine-specific)